MDMELEALEHENSVLRDIERKVMLKKENDELRRKYGDVKAKTPSVFDALAAKGVPVRDARDFK